VIDHFDAIWDSAAGAFGSERMHLRARKLALAAMACLGRHTVTGMVCTSAERFRDWSPDYRLVARQRFDQAKLFEAVVSQVVSALQPNSPLEVAIDDTNVRKSGRKVSGAQWRPDRMGPKFQVNLMWGIRYLQISAALPQGPQVASQACMVPIEFKHCPSPAKPGKSATSDQVANYRAAAKLAAMPARAVSALGDLRKRVDSDRPILCAADGGFTNRTVLKSLPHNLTFVGRIRKDAKLFAIPKEQKLLGRRRVYGAQLPTPDQMRIDDTLAWQDISVHVGGQVRTVQVKAIKLRWKPAGANDLQLLIIRPLKYKLTRNGRTWYRDPVYLICTDPELNITQAVQAYMRRWGIEQNFRDEKQVLGIGQSYVRSPQSLQSLPALIVAAYAMLRIACLKTKCTIAQPKWRTAQRKKHLTADQEIAALRSDLWGTALGHTTEHFSGFANKPTRDTKPPKLSTTLASAVLYASRC
jgi:hypothetical protein